MPAIFNRSFFGSKCLAKRKTQQPSIHHADTAQLTHARPSTSLAKRLFHPLPPSSFTSVAATGWTCPATSRPTQRAPCSTRASSPSCQTTPGHREVKQVINNAVRIRCSLFGFFFSDNKRDHRSGRESSGIRPQSG